MLKLMTQMMINKSIKLTTVKRSLLVKMNAPIKQVSIIENKYIPNNKLENSIKTSLQSPTCGVYVLYAPYATGKTTSVRRIADELRTSQELSGVIIESLDNTVLLSNSLLNWLKIRWNISNKVKNTKLSDLIYKQNKPVAIILDNFEDAMGLKNIEDCVTILAEDSDLTKHYTVLLCVNNPSFGKEIVSWNGGAKIQSISNNTHLFNRFKV